MECYYVDKKVQCCSDRCGILDISVRHQSQEVVHPLLFIRCKRSNYERVGENKGGYLDRAIYKSFYSTYGMCKKISVSLRATIEFKN